MTERAFPWPHGKIQVAVFQGEDPGADVVLLRVRCAEHGALFEEDGGLLSIHERGWIPIAWRVDDTPERDDEQWPPLWTDYLTEKVS